MFVVCGAWPPRSGGNRLGNLLEISRGVCYLACYQVYGTLVYTLADVYACIRSLDSSRELSTWYMLSTYQQYLVHARYSSRQAEHLRIPSYLF